MTTATAAAPKPRLSASRKPENRWKSHLGSRNAFLEIYDLSPVERSTLIKHRVPARMVVSVCDGMGISRDRFVKMMGLARSTIDRKIQDKREMSVDESEKLVGISRLIGQVETIVAESGNPDGFDAAKWFAEWMSQPVAALGGLLPEQLLDTADGREAIGTLLAQMQSGAYA